MVQATATKNEAAICADAELIAAVRYPFRIFYPANDQTIDISHIRHTSRHPSEI